MNGGVLTLPYFQPSRIQVAPAVRAPLRNLEVFLRKFVFGPPMTSPTVTTIPISAEKTQKFDANELSRGTPTTFVGDRAQRIQKFFEALTDALELNATMIDAEEGDPIDDQTLQYAVQSLGPLIAFFEIPTPLILPLQNGGIGAEWHTSGMNIELRFRKPYDVYVLLEDVQGTASFHGRDPDLVHTHPALHELSRRPI